MQARWHPRAPGVAWLALCAVFILGSLWAGTRPSVALDWQPGRVLSEPWRAWTAAFVHWSPLHLGANLAGLLLVAALGWVGRVPAALTAAWFIAWPLTQWALLLQPGLAHYGGLSGVLHGGVAAAAVWLLGVERRRRPRLLATAILAGLLVKVLLEEPWGAPLRQAAGWDIALAPIAHATGLLAGALLAAAVVLRARAVAQRTGRWAGGSDNPGPPR